MQYWLKTIYIYLSNKVSNENFHLNAHNNIHGNIAHYVYEIAFWVQISIDLYSDT